MVDMDKNMKLHRAIRSDWSDIPPQERSMWQRWASGSRGIITPANIISILGAILVVIGLFFLSSGQLIDGIWAIFIGRVADILDGMVADYTKTKSPLGEAIDASVDKVVIVLALFVLVDKNLLPILIGLTMGIHALYNAGVSVVARRFKISLHPSRAGKLSAVFEWGTVVFYLLGDILTQRQHSPAIGHDVGLVSFGLFVILAVWSSLNYTRSVYYKRIMRA